MLNICPICNSSDIELHMRAYGYYLHEVEYFCICNKCGLKTPVFNNDIEAIGYWNHLKGINNWVDYKK